MNRITKLIRSNRETSRNRRELGRAIDRAATPAMRDEIILMAQRHGHGLSR